MTGTPLENAMAITLSDNGSITTDESGGLQNLTATSGILGDSDDNDIAVAAINNFDDANDLPLAFESRLFALLGAVTPMQTALSGYTGAAGNTGTDLITITGTYLDLAFTDAEGNALGDPNNANAGTDWSGLYTLDGRRIFLYTDSTNNNIVLGRIGAEGTTDAPEDDLADPNGTIVFSAYLEQTATGAKVWMAQFAPLQNPVTSNPDDVVDMTDHLWATASQDAAFDFAGVPSGQNKFLMFKAGSSDVGLVVTGMDPDKIVNGKDAGDTVNTSQGGGATTIGTNNQGVDPGEGMIFTFVTNPNPAYTVPGLTHGEAIVEDNIDFGELFGATGATFVIAQQTPPKASTARISAYTTDFEEKSDYYEGLLDADDNLAYITSVTIRDGNGNIIAGLGGVTANTTVGNITVTFNPTNNNTDRTVTIAGFQSKYSIEYTTSELHNRVLIENIGNANPQLNSPFDIGGFHLPNIVAEPQQIGSAVNFEDDGPTALAALGAGLVRHDETAGPDGDADDVASPLAVFAAVATVSTDMTAAYAQGSASVIDSSASSGGQDGLASTVYSLNVASAGVDSGLDTTEGNSILLTKEGALVVGRISGGADNGEAAFAVAIDANTGVLSVVQYHSIKHPTGGASHDESLAINIAALLAVVTVTDGDGDTDTASVGIGARVAFQDDGPTASAVLAAGLVRHDETAGPDGDADDVASPLAVFAAVATVSTDMTAAYAQGSASVINSNASSGGQDGLVSTAYSLNVASAGVDSGLDTTEGISILLFKEGALVVGRISGGTDNGEAAFAVAIDASTGVLSVVQYHSIKHPTGGASHDESLAIDNAALLAVATVTDGDGDTQAASVGIGARVAFQDDGPTASAALGAGLVRHDETAGPDGDADDVASPLAVFAAVATVSTDMTAAYAQGSASVINSNASSGGQDGLVSTAYSLNVASAGVDSGLDTTEGISILLFKEGALVVGRISGGTDNGEAAFAVAINSITGVLSVVQYHSIKHPTGGASYDESLAIDNAALLAVATVTDGDGDTDTASVGIGARVSFQDDGPTASGTPVTATVDEDGLPGGIAGGTNDVIGEVASASDSIASIFQSGVDNPLTYGLSTNTSNLLQTLTSKGEAVKYDVTGNTLTAYVDVGASDGIYQAADREVFTFALTAATGAYVFTQLDQLDHPSLNGGPGDNTENDLVLQLGTILQATDADGDTVTAAAEKLVITVDDDSPLVTAKSNLVYRNSANPSPGGTGTFAYDIGADDRLGTLYSASNSDLSVSMTGVSVGANTLTNRSVTWFSENDATAVFNITFTYVSNNPTQGATTNATGTLTFDKVADTYTLSLTDEIESFSILRTSTAKGFTGYAIGGTTPINQQPPVSVANLADDFFVQFSGFAEASGGTGANNIKAGGDNAFIPGELFSAATSWVSVSGTAAGVAGDTIQQGEVMDLDFFTANPFGNTSLAPTATSNGIFIKFDGIGNEDLVLVLKLVDPDGSNNPITRAIIVDSQDIILKTPSTTNNNFHPIANPAAYGITLDQNDGAVILERNDYNFGNEDYVIQGVQVLTSTEGVTGNGYNLNGNVGVTGASTGATLAFGNEDGEGSKSNPVEAGEAGTWDGDVVKIVDMGFVTSSTPDAHLTFDVTVTDFDGDSNAAQTLDVTIAGGKTFTGGAGVDTFSFKALDADTDGALSAATSVISAGFASGVDKLDFTTAGSGANYSEVLTSVANLETFISDANAALNGTTSYYFGVVGGNGYLAQDGDGVGTTNIIQLVGVTNMASTDIV
jgi:T1SS-143 domain-containing protein